MPSSAARPSPTSLANIARTACLLSITLLAWARPAAATFHLVEINKVMAGFEGDASVQAVELRMLAAGENLVGAASIRAYDAAGSPVSVLGTFAADLPATGSVTGARILCATSAFATRFGITPDLVIAPGIPATTGQISFEKSICFVNALAYGAVTTFKNGASAAPPLPIAGAPVLVRTVNDATVPSCPLAEDASPAAVAFGVTPNPFRSSTVIRAPRARRISIYDVRGRLVRDLLPPSGGANANAVRWTGDDGRGGAVPSGIYFVRYEDENGVRILRLAVIR